MENPCFYDVTIQVEGCAYKVCMNLNKRCYKNYFQRVLQLGPEKKDFGTGPSQKQVVPDAPRRTRHFQYTH